LHVAGGIENMPNPYIVGSKANQEESFVV